MYNLPHVDVTTKMHCLIPLLDHHLVHLVCIRCRSSEENEILHEELEDLYASMKKHL